MLLYNVLFRSPKTGEESPAQIEAFEDTWHWSPATELAFDEVMKSGNSDAAEMLRAMRSFLKENDMMAYLTMMAVRLIDALPQAQFEVHGVPKDVEGARALAEADKHQFQLWALSMLEAQPYKGGQKGADRGIDGYLYFNPDGKVTEKAIVSIKGGGHVSDTMLKDLITTVDHEGAKMGVFVTLTPPTQPMKTRAVAAGFYETEYGQFSKIQILTIEDLFKGQRPHMPWIDASVFKKAKREQTTKQNELDL